MNLYITGDAIGTPTGGGKVTFHESEALRATGDETIVWSLADAPRPWGPDIEASARLLANPKLQPKRAHLYSGTFTKTVGILRARGTYVTYTAAAHDINVSRAEHEDLGLPYDYPHLTDPDKWQQYLGGYRLANRVVCPSSYSARIMESYGCDVTTVIPHGYDPVDKIAPFPKHFTVGYLGQPGPDKGLRYLIAAWAIWNRKKPLSAWSAQLVIAGRGTQALLPLVDARELHGSFYLCGEVSEPRDLYDACCLYVQPSASEGFGCEVLEAQAHGRTVVCSDGAGACPLSDRAVRARDAHAIVRAIDEYHTRWRRDPTSLIATPKPDLTWERIRVRYTELFKS